MVLDSIPLFSMLKSRLGYVSERERLIAQNVANASTPGYAPKDLKAFSLSEAMGAQGGSLAMVQPARTDPGHLAAPSGDDSGGGQSGWKVISTIDSESSLDGNSVVLEDQMAKMSQSRMDYEAAIGFYQKALGMLRTAARAPGK